MSCSPNASLKNSPGAASANSAGPAASSPAPSDTPAQSDIANSEVGAAADEGAAGVAPGASSSEPAPAQQPAGETHTVACLGDSITFGYGLRHPETDSWPALLEGMLGDGWQVANLGVSGATLMDEGDLPYRGTGNIEVAKQLQPEIAFVMLGTNDAFSSVWNAEAYRTQLYALADELAAAVPGVRLVLMAPPPSFYETPGSDYDEYMDLLLGEHVRGIVSEVAQARGATFVDLFALGQGHPEWFPDALHPDAEGHQAIAEHIYREAFGG